MDDDFDTPNALKTLVNYAAHLSKLAKKQKIDARSKAKAEATFQRISKVIGITV
jgi:cysteinyl-tRNA synthetase